MEPSPSVSGQELIFSKSKCVMASDSRWLRGKRAECSQCGAAEERLVTRLITEPGTRQEGCGEQKHDELAGPWRRATAGSGEATV